MVRMLSALLLSVVTLVACQTPEAPEARPVTPAVSTAPADARFSRLMETARAQNVHARPFGQVVQWVGEQLRGTPYVAGVLDAPPSETLTAPLDKFDCVLFVESTLALARGIAAQDYGYDAYLRRVEQQRYRGGRLDGYCSRLHYFTDWIYDNDRRGNVRDVTRAVGGVPFEKTLDFMGTHRDAYPRLAADSTFQCILGVEASMRDRALYFVPQARIRAVYGQLQPGDVIATATDIDGLDVTHTGFVYRTPEGGTGFIHASLTGEVKVSSDLAGYVQGNARQIGILVARPVPPQGGS